MVNNEITEFNLRLKDKYGLDVGLGLPNYHIVWTSDEFEVRKGTYNDFSDDGVFLRTITEVRKTEKYPLFPNKWVLETIQENKNNPELPDAKYSYEPLHIFGAGKSHPMPVWEMVDRFVQAHKFVMRKVKSPSDIQDEEDKRFLKEIASHKEIIQDAGSAFAGAMKAGEAVTVLSDHNKPVKTIDF